MKLRLNITLKLTLLVLLGTGAILAFILSYSGIYSKSIILTDAEASARNRAQSISEQVDRELFSIVKIIKNLALALEYGQWDESSIDSLLRGVVEDNPDIFGSTAAFEPNALKQGLRQFAPYYCKTDEGVKFVQLATEEYNYLNKDWYRIPKGRGVPVWSPPYFDEGGGDVIMTTYSHPFFGKGPAGESRGIRGILTADLSLVKLTDIISSVKILKTGYAFLVSDNGTFLAYPDKRFIMKETIFTIADGMGDKSLREVGNAMLSKNSGFLDLPRSFRGREVFLAFSRLESTGWSIGVVFPKQELFSEVAVLQTTIRTLAVCGLALLVAVSFLASRSVTEPLRKIAQATTKVAQGDLDIDLTDIKRKDEIGQLAQSFTSMAGDLKKYIKDLTETTAAKQRIESELSIASNIQQSMLPSKFPAFPDRDEFDIYAIMKPAKQVGGDFYDFFLKDEDHLCFAIGDVSDKGVPASLFTAVTKYLIEAAVSSEASPAAVLEKVNSQLSRNNESCMFVTIFFGVLDLRTGELLYSNGGHNPPVLISENGAEYLGRPGGPLLGIMEDAAFTTDGLMMKKGDTLLTYTDGVTEAMDTESRLFSDARLRDLLDSAGEKPLVQITDELLREIAAFTKGAPQSDDITILAVRYAKS